MSLGQPYFKSHKIQFLTASNRSGPISIKVGAETLLKILLISLELLYMSVSTGLISNDCPDHGFTVLIHQYRILRDPKIGLAY